MGRYARDDDDEIFTLNHYYIVEPIAGELRTADDVSGCRWFGMDDLPHMAFEHEKQVLEDLRERLGHG